MTPKAQKNVASVADIADYVLRDTTKPPVVVLGPAVWTIQKGSGVKRWYFMVACVSTDSFLRFDQVVAPLGREHAESIRADLTWELTMRKPVVIHYFDDEAEMARFCEALCPNDKTRSICAGIEDEPA